MLSASRAFKRLDFLWLLAGVAPAVLGQNAYAPQGEEFPIAGSLPGDRVYPQIGAGANGGYLVWQDNVTDGDGWGISARRINSSLSGSFGVFRVNEQSAGDQENVRVALLKDGGATFVWQGGKPGFQHIYARFLKGDGTFAGGDQMVNTYTNNHQINPAVAVLADGKVAVAWSSYGQDGDLYGVYAQLFSAVGEKVGGEFQVNQTASLSQRAPSVAALPEGGFVIAWVSEKSLGVDTNGAPRYTAAGYVRRFNADADPRENEFQLNTGTELAANPVVCASPNGGFAVVWSRKGSVGVTTSVLAGASWDVYARFFDSAGAPLDADLRVNSYTYGDQFAPKIDCIGSEYLVVWTSLAQDGSREGVYGQFLSGNGLKVGDEFRVNTTTISQQLHPAVASDGTSRFVVVWSSFIGGASSFDLFAQRYALSQSLPAPAAPFVFAPFDLDIDGHYQPQLQVSWPALGGLPLAAYEVYVDGAATPAATIDTNIWTLSGLNPGSIHSFQVDYLTTDGRHSPLSPAATGKTWSGANYGGIPFEWMSSYFGPDVLSWPKPTDDSDGDGDNNLHEFLAGTVPTNPGSVMRIQLVSSAQGTRLSWNSTPGLIYQVQMSEELVSWKDLDSPRLAAETNDSILLNGTGSAAYYRVVRLR